MVYDLVIIGGASAGLSAAIYAARKKLNFILLTDKVGGQSLLTDSIENYPGFVSISGPELVKKMEEQALALGAEIKEKKLLKSVLKIDKIFEIETHDGEKYQTKTIIIASGKHPRPLNVPGEKELTGKGVSYCSICDAPLFQEVPVAVVGGGNSGLESATDSVPYASLIYVLEFGPKIIGDEETQEKLKKTGKVEFIVNAQTLKVAGDKFVDGLVYKDRISGEEKELKVKGIFVNVGQTPSAGFVKDFLELNQQGEIAIDHKTNQTSVEGIFAAGDVTDIKYKQCVVAAAEGAKAALSAYNYLQKASRP